MSLTEQHKVESLSKRARLSDYAPGKFQNIFTKKGIKKAIKQEMILIDGRIGRTGDYIFGGELLELVIPESNYPILNLALDVLFEDDFLALIAKPPGIEVSGNKVKTIQNALGNNLAFSTQPDALQRMEPVHRLDFPTSGILLISKTRSSTIVLNQLFESRQVKKVYYAISLGKINIESPISEEIDHKKSLTNYKIMDTVASDRLGRLNLVKLQPHTGRRHQIRKHLSIAGSPILGDKLYGSNSVQNKGKGLYLHAYSLGFEHPFTKQPLLIKSPLPKKFLRIFPNAG